MSGRPIGARAPVLNPRRSAPEKREERLASKLMAALNFARWNLQQARATNQSPGWPDVLYTHPEKRLAVYYEAKSPTGKQSAAQKEFQRHVTACGHEYVVGTHHALVDWCRARGLIR